MIKEATNANAELIKAFLEWLRGGHSVATQESYRYGLFHIERWSNKQGLFIQNLKVKEATSFLAHLENRGLKGGARAQYVTALKTMLRWLYRQEKFAFDPSIIPTPSREDSKSHETLEPHEFEALIGVFNNYELTDIRDKCMIAMLYATGVRLGELLSMGIGNIDIQEKKGIVKTFKRKNHKRAVYWDDGTNEILIRWLKARHEFLEHHEVVTSHLFVAVEKRSLGNVLKKGNVNRIFRIARKSAGITKQVTPHSCRHGFGFRAVKANANIRHLQEMLGHAKLNTTMIYMGVDRADVEKEYRRIFEDKA